MPQSQSALSATTAIEFPVCAKCGALMRLSRIEPDTPAHERRFFDCVECEQSEALVAKFR